MLLVARLLRRLTARRSWFMVQVRFPHGALLALGGRSSPDLQCSGGLSPGPFCVEFACSPRVHKGFPPLKTPTEKTCKRTEHSSSVPDQDRRFTSPGPRALKKLPTAPGVLEEGQSGMGKKQRLNSLRPQACVGVCVLCRLHVFTCVLQCVACAIKV